MSGWRQRLLRYGAGESRGLTAIGLLMLAAVTLDTLKPWPLKLLVDHVFSRVPPPAGLFALFGALGAQSPVAQAGLLAVASVVLASLAQFLAMLQRTLQAVVGARIGYRLAADVFARLQRLSLLFHARSRTGDLVRRVMTDSGCARDLVINVGLPAVASAASLLAMLTAMCLLSPVLALLALGAAVPMALIMRLLAARMQETAFAQQQLEGELSAVAEQALGALPVVQAFGREESEEERFRRVSQQTLQAHLASLKHQLQFKFGISGLTALATAALMALGGFRVLGGELTVGGLLVFLSYLASLYAPLETLTYLSVGYASAAAGARRVFAVLEDRDEVAEAADAVELPRDHRRGSLCWEGVRFGYQPGRDVLAGISLEIKPGEIVALVGRTGAGKSTLAALVPRFFDPWQGRVLVNGVDVRRVTLASLRAEIGLVLQEPFLLPMSIADNIAYGRPEAAPEEIEAAARAANAHDFIVGLPNGYDTVIGERGATLSGGERQRLAIARAFLKDAPILILDEPTSALDAATEQAVLDALERLMSGRTTLIIAHRLSTIQRANRVVVLNKGVIAEAGSCAELLAAGGLFARMHRSSWPMPARGRP